VLSKQFLQLVWTGYRERITSDAQKLLVTKFCQGPGQRFARGSHLGGKQALGSVEFNFDFRRADWPRALFQQPIGQPRFHVFQSEIVEQSYDDAKMLAHGTQHAQRELGTPSQQIDKIVFRDEQNSSRLRRTRIGWVAAFGRERRFCKRFNRAKQFATSHEREIDALTRAFSVYRQTEDGTISHGFATALINRDGNIDKIWRGNGWTPAEVIEAIQAEEK
jgi:hypothetical protein